MVKWFSRLMTVLILLTFSISLSLPISQVKGMPLAGATVTPNITWDDFDTGAYDGSCSLREAIYSVIHNENYGGCTHTGYLGQRYRIPPARYIQPVHSRDRTRG